MYPEVKDLLGMDTHQLNHLARRGNIEVGHSSPEHTIYLYSLVMVEISAIHFNLSEAESQITQNIFEGFISILM